MTVIATVTIAVTVRVPGIQKCVPLHTVLLRIFALDLERVCIPNPTVRVLELKTFFASDPAFFAFESKTSRVSISYELFTDDFIASLTVNLRCEVVYMNSVKLEALRKFPVDFLR